MKNLIDYIVESQFEDWEKEYYIYRKENGFKGTIEDLYTDKDGFSSEMASDFYKMYLQTKKDTPAATKYRKEMGKMIDKEDALETSCKERGAEELSWLVASGIESAVPVETIRHAIPGYKNVTGTMYKVNFRGRDIYFYDKVFKNSYGAKGYATTPGFSICVTSDFSYDYGDAIISVEAWKKGQRGYPGYKNYLTGWDDSVHRLIEIIDNRINKYYK